MWGLGSRKQVDLSPRPTGGSRTRIENILTGSPTSVRRDLEVGSGLADGRDNNRSRLGVLHLQGCGSVAAGAFDLVRVIRINLARFVVVRVTRIEVPRSGGTAGSGHLVDGPLCCGPRRWALGGTAVEIALRAALHQKNRTNVLDFGLSGDGR